jgi:hypothetical protein
MRCLDSNADQFVEAMMKVFKEGMSFGGPLERKRTEIWRSDASLESRG